MGFFTFKKGHIGASLSAHSSFKSFIVLVVMILMTASSVMAEVIDGIRYNLDSDTKTATLLPKKYGGYSGDINIPEKVKGNDGVAYSVISLGNNCFDGCIGLTSITIPSSVTSLGNECFRKCSALTSITIPSSVTSLGYECFCDCSALTSITIPSSVTSLGYSCFSGCRALTSITIPSSVTSLGDKCFYNCCVLTSITIPSSVTKLGDSCFGGCSGLTSITIPSSVTSLGNKCFYGCIGLLSITIPSSVTSLGYECFCGCIALTSIIIPSSVTKLGRSCFLDCSGLTSITIPPSVTSLGENCFYNCCVLTSITIPSSVTSLGEDCFKGCSDLETIYFKGKVPKIYGFHAGIPTSSIIKVPAEYLQDYKNAFGSNYQYIYAWNPNESGDDDKPVPQCATPSISYESGELKFASETPGANYYYTISDKDMATDALNKNGKVSLSAAYDISVYATADGYSASEKAKATLYWVNANLENATNINQARTRGIVASAHDGIVSISGLDNGEVVKFYAADGKLIGSSSAVDGTASCAVSETMVIAKFGDNAIKVAVK